MSDGPSDCAYAAEARAEKLVKTRFAGVRRVKTPLDAPKHGTVILVYEEWLDHIVELIIDRLVKKRWLCPPFKGPRLMPIDKNDWPAGYYRDHHIPKK